MGFKDQKIAVNSESKEVEQPEKTKKYVSAEVDVDDWEKVLPLGLWDGLINKEPIFDKNKKTGLKQLTIPLAVITENENHIKTERKAKVVYSFAPTAVGFTREVFDELGIEYDFKNGNVLFAPEDFTDMEVMVEVYKNKQGYRNIKLHNSHYKPVEE